jgi:hypothetical protein
VAEDVLEILITAEAKKIVEETKREWERNPEPLRRIADAMANAARALVELARVYGEVGGYVVSENLAATLAWAALNAFDWMVKVAAREVRRGVGEGMAFAEAVSSCFSLPMFARTLVALRATLLMGEEEGEGG